MGRAWASGGMSHGWVTTVVQIKLQLFKVLCAIVLSLVWITLLVEEYYFGACLSPLQRRNPFDFANGWKRARKSFWTSWACWCVQCSHLRIKYLHLGFEWSTVETLGVVTAYAVVFCTLYCNTLISILSPEGFQLPTFHAGWCSSAVLLFLSPRVSTSNLVCWLVLVCCNLSLLRVSAASLSLIHCNVVSLSSEVSFAILSCSWVLFRCKVTCLSLAVWVAHLVWSLSLSFLNLSLLCSVVSAARQALSLSVPSPVFLLLRWFGSSSRTVLGIHVQQNL